MCNFDDFDYDGLEDNFIEDFIIEDAFENVLMKKVFMSFTGNLFKTTGCMS